MERFIAVTCIEGIMATGDGTRDRPYTALRTSDEYDVIQYAGQEVIGQSLVGDAGRHFDVMTCGDGTELWFDITTPYGRLRDQFGG